MLKRIIGVTMASVGIISGAYALDVLPHDYDYVAANQAMIASAQAKQAMLNDSGSSNTSGGSNTSGAAIARRVGQMMMVGFSGTEISGGSIIVQEIKNDHIGGVILFPYSTTSNPNGNILNPEQLQQLTSQLQAYAKQYNDYPLFISANEEGGYINGLSPTHGFSAPYINDSALTIGNMDNPSIAYAQGKGLGTLLLANGVNMNMAPDADLCLNPNSTVIAEWHRSFGTDPNLVTTMDEQELQGYHDAGVIAMMKHFPGLGSALQNTDLTPFVDVTSVWQKIELQPYQQVIDSPQCPPVIMVSHEINCQLDKGGYPASLSHKMVTGILRHQLGYKGVIITDDMDAAAIYDCFTHEEATYLAVMAGDNIILYGGSLNEGPYQAADEEELNMTTLASDMPEFMSKVNQSYQLIKALKIQMLKEENPSGSDTVQI